MIAGAVLGARTLIDQLWPRMLTYGGSIDPHACFLLKRGLKTLAIRMCPHRKAPANNYGLLL